jgi:hypothetical protein
MRLILFQLFVRSYEIVHSHVHDIAVDRAYEIVILFCWKCVSVRQLLLSARLFKLIGWILMPFEN